MKKEVAILFILLMIGSLILVCNFELAKATNPLVIQWTQIYGAPPNATASDLIQTSDGGYAIAEINGTINHTLWDESATLEKTDAFGVPLWSNVYGTYSHGLSPFYVIQTLDNGYIMEFTGYIPGGYAASSLIKTDLTGKQQLWRINLSIYQYQTENLLLQTNDGSIVWGGRIINTVTLQGGIWLNKTDSSGNLLWGKTYGNGSYAYSIVQTSDEGFALAGQQGGNALLIKTDSAGNEIWSKMYGSFAGVTSVVQTSDGGYVLAAGNELIKTDSSGNLQWNQTYGSSISSIVQTNDGGYLLAMGNMLIKTDSSGNLQWNQTFVGVNIACIINTSDGGYALAGTYSVTNGTYFWLSKVSLSPTPTPTPTATPTSSSTPSPSLSPTPSPTPTVTPTPSPSPSPTPSPSPSPAPTASPTQTPTQTTSPTASPTTSPTTSNPTATPTVPEFSSLAVITALMAMLLVSVVMLTLRKRKISKS